MGEDEEQQQQQQEEEEEEEDAEEGEEDRVTMKYTLKLETEEEVEGNETKRTRKGSLRQQRNMACGEERTREEEKQVKGRRNMEDWRRREGNTCTEQACRQVIDGGLIKEGDRVNRTEEKGKRW